MDTEQNASESQPQYRPAIREGARLTVIESVQIGLELQEARERPDPVPWKELSRRYGLPVRTLQYQWARYQERRAIYTDPTGVQLLRQSAHLFEKLLEEAFDLVERSENPLVRIGAIRTANKLLDDRCRLFNLACEYSNFIYQKELLAEFARELLAVLERDNMPLEVREEVEDIYHRAKAATPLVQV